MSDKYILDGKVAVKLPEDTSLHQWAETFEQRHRQAVLTGVDPWRVAEDMVGDARISTVFLGLDHAFGGGPPLIFETMVFGGTLDGHQDRCSTWEEAEAMHADVTAQCRRSLQ